MTLFFFGRMTKTLLPLLAGHVNPGNILMNIVNSRKDVLQIKGSNKSTGDNSSVKVLWVTVACSEPAVFLRGEKKIHDCT